VAPAHIAPLLIFSKGGARSGRVHRRVARAATPKKHPTLTRRGYAPSAHGGRRHTSRPALRRGAKAGGDPVVPACHREQARPASRSDPRVGRTPSAPTDKRRTLASTGRCGSVHPVARRARSSASTGGCRVLATNRLHPEAAAGEAGKPSGLDREWLRRLACALVG
jgi:hypothetical protein